MLKHNSFSILFAFIFVLHLSGIAMEYSMLVSITKPMIAGSLLLYVYNVTHLSNAFQKRIFAGLIFSLIGDILLMMVDKNPNFFIAGLVAFLLAQLSYITAFYLDFKQKITHNKVLFLIAVFAFNCSHSIAALSLSAYTSVSCVIFYFSRFIFYSSRFLC